jgi:hypothetical protein
MVIAFSGRLTILRRGLNANERMSQIGFIFALCALFVSFAFKIFVLEKGLNFSSDKFEPRVSWIYTNFSLHGSNLCDPGDLTALDF